MVKFPNFSHFRTKKVEITRKKWKLHSKVVKFGEEAAHLELPGINGLVSAGTGVLTDGTRGKQC